MENLGSILNNSSNRQTLGGILYLAFMMTVGTYFAISSVQGDSGMFRRIEIDAKAEMLVVEKAAILVEVEDLRNLTHRMSDQYLDIDLLDQQAREVLGYIRADEIVIR
jgi:cell division protein FtsB